MKTILIDDEPLAVARLKRLLAKYADFEIIDEAKNGQEGLEKIAAGFQLSERYDFSVSFLFYTKKFYHPKIELKDSHCRQDIGTKVKS